MKFIEKGPGQNINISSSILVLQAAYFMRDMSLQGACFMRDLNLQGACLEREYVGREFGGGELC